MASEINQDVQLIVEKVYSKFSSADLSQFPEKLAIQVNLTGKISGVFYIEVLNGVLWLNRMNILTRMLLSALQRQIYSKFWIVN